MQSSNAEHEYSKIDGNGEFNRLSIELAYGSDNAALKENRIAVCQSISGTGALRIGGVFLNRFYAGETQEKRKIYLPAPTWGNHPAVFNDSGLQPTDYRYFNAKKNCLDFDGLMEDLHRASDGSIFLFHACAHNPTGVDPTPNQWVEMSKKVREKRHICFFDMAYQGFATGNPDMDAFSLRKFVADGNAVLLAQSYAKNFGLYGERAGTFSVVAQSVTERQAIESQLKLIIRPMYSNPPIHGAKIVREILENASLRTKWTEEIKIMANRIIEMRKTLKQKLIQNGSTLDWEHITNQIGMFCYTGLDSMQVEMLTKEFHIYLTKDGRISIAGINSSNIDHLAYAIHQVAK